MRKNPFVSEITHYLIEEPISVPPRQQIILPNEVVEVEGLLLAQAYYREDGSVSVACRLCVLDGGGAEETALIPYVHIYIVRTILLTN